VGRCPSACIHGARNRVTLARRRRQLRRSCGNGGGMSVSRDSYDGGNRTGASADHRHGKLGTAVDRDVSELSGAACCACTDTSRSSAHHCCEQPRASSSCRPGGNEPGPSPLPNCALPSSPNCISGATSAMISVGGAPQRCISCISVMMRSTSSGVWSNTASSAATRLLCRV